MEQQNQVIQEAKENVNLIDANNIKVATALGLIHIILVMVIFFAFSAGILLIMSAIYMSIRHICRFDKLPPLGLLGATVLGNLVAITSASLTCFPLCSTGHSNPNPVPESVLCFCHCLCLLLSNSFINL